MRNPVNRRAVALATAACVALAGTAAAPASAIARTRAKADHRGTLAAAPVRLGVLSADQTRAALDEAGFAQAGVRYGVELDRLVYRTVDAAGRATTASGLIVLPRNRDRSPRLVSFTHGTESFKKDAPSMGEDTFSPAPALTFGAAGFAAVAPDYLGLGEGPGTHPWMDVPSETTASLDMLRAARAFMAGRGRTPQRRVLVTGFSQGASAALGLARALQDGADPWYRLGAVAPISGAYAFRDAELPAVLAGREIPPKLGVAYTTYLLVSWNRLHHLYDAPGEVFQAPYADKVDRLFDGTTPGQEMLAALPGSLDALLTPRGLDLLRHPSGAFAQALRVADATCTGWVPNAPARLYYATGDEQAVTANTDRCRAAFRASGADLRTVELGPIDYQGSRHLGSAVRGTVAITDWFSRLPA